MPVGVSLRRFLPFSPWRASARPRLKSQKSLKYPSPSGAGSFAGAEMCSGDKKPAGNAGAFPRTLRMHARISARQNRICPCQWMVPL